METRRAIWIGIGLALILLGGGYLYYRNQLAPPAAQPAPAPAPPAEAPPPEHYPVPETKPEEAPAEKPLPKSVDESDAALLESLRKLGGAQPVESFLVPDRMIRRWVATVDSLDRSDPIPPRLRAIAPTPGAFEVNKQTN